MLRASLHAALANPARGRDDAIFASLEGYMDALEGAPMPPADRALLLALVHEPRVATIDQGYQLRDLFANDLAALRAAIVARLLALPVSGDPIRAFRCEFRPMFHAGFGKGTLCPLPAGQLASEALADHARRAALVDVVAP